jgi:hypothetical protein
MQLWVAQEARYFLKSTKIAKKSPSMCKYFCIFVIQILVNIEHVF